MCRVVEVRGDYKILFTGTGKWKYTVKSISGEYENHGHFSKISICRTIVDLVTRKQVPKKNHFIESAIRLTTDDKYRERLEIKLEKNKNRQYFFKPQKGPRMIY